MKLISLRSLASLLAFGLVAALPQDYASTPKVEVVKKSVVSPTAALLIPASSKSSSEHNKPIRPILSAQAIKSATVVPIRPSTVFYATHSPSVLPVEHSTEQQTPAPSSLSSSTILAVESTESFSKTTEPSFEKSVETSTQQFAEHSTDASTESSTEFAPEKSTEKLIEAKTEATTMLPTIEFSTEEHSNKQLSESTTDFSLKTTERPMEKFTESFDQPSSTESTKPLAKIPPSLVKKSVMTQYETMKREALEISRSCVGTIEELLGISLEADVTEYAVASYLGLVEGRMNMMASMDALDTRFEQVPLKICRETAYQWFAELLADRHNSTGYDFIRGALVSFFQYRGLRDVVKDDGYLFSEVVDARERALDDPTLVFLPLANRSNMDEPVFNVGSLPGFAVLRMIKRVMGRQQFYSALSKFLLNKKFSGDLSEDLISAFEGEMNEKPLCGALKIREFVYDYLYEPNFPVVYVDVDAENRTFVFAQSATAPVLTKWNVPMFVWNNRTEKIAVFWLLKDGSVCMPDGQVGGLDYDKATFLFNYNGYSFARFVYSDEVMKQIFKLPDTQIVNEASQLNLLYEEKWLNSFNYQMDLQKLLRKILIILRKPTNKRFDFPDMNISSMRWKTLLQKFTVDSNGTLSPQMADQAHDLLDDKDIWNMQCSWDATDYRCGHYNKRHLQSAVMNNFTDSRAVGRRMFEEFVKSCANSNDFSECNKIPLDSRMAVYCAGMIDESPEHFAFMDRYKSYIREMMDIYGLFHDEYAYITEGFVC